MTGEECVAAEEMTAQMVLLQKQLDQLRYLSLTNVYLSNNLKSLEYFNHFSFALPFLDDNANITQYLTEMILSFSYFFNKMNFMFIFYNEITYCLIY